jgi:hypothetical protein
LAHAAHICTGTAHQRERFAWWCPCQPYTLIVNDTGVAEQKIGTCGDEAQHCAGTPLAATVKVLSNKISNGKRTVVMTRGMAGATVDHYTFSPAEQSTIQLLTAVGSSFVFGYHAGHVPTTLTLTSRDGRWPAVRWVALCHAQWCSLGAQTGLQPASSARVLG